MIRFETKKFSDLSNELLIQWENLITKIGEASIFQTKDWIQLMAQDFNANCEIIFAYDDSKLVGLFPYYLTRKKIIFRKYTTSMFETPYGGPIVLNQYRDELLKKLIVFQRQKLFVLGSSIIFPPDEIGINFEIKNVTTTTKETLIVSLDRPIEEIENSMDKMKVRNIRKAIKNNIQIRDSGPKSVSDFHNLLKETYSRLGLEPPVKLEFYNNLFRHLEPKGRIKLVLAYLDEKPIAASIFLLFNKTIIYWQGASLREYMKFAPNDLIHWSIIKMGHESGYKFYNMLHFHDDKGNEITSLKKYKLSFGSEFNEYKILTS